MQPANSGDSAQVTAKGIQVEHTCEAQIVLLDQKLAECEKQAKALLARISTARKKAGTGEFAVIASQFEPVPRHMEQIAASIQAARESLTYDTQAALADGSYLAELQAAAATEDVVLIERDGRLSAFPLLLKLEPKAGAIRIGRKLDRRLRPGTVMKVLRKAQATSRFDAGRFLKQLF